MTSSTRPFHFHFPFRVRFSEVDPQNIVFNSRYLEYCDAAFIEYFRAAGLRPMDMLSVHQFNAVVKRVELDFIAPARLDDLVHVYVRIAEVGRTSLTGELEVRPADAGAALVRARIKYVNVDLATGRAAPIPPSIRDMVTSVEGDAILR